MPGFGMTSTQIWFHARSAMCAGWSVGRVADSGRGCARLASVGRARPHRVAARRDRPLGGALAAFEAVEAFSQSARRGGGAASVPSGTQVRADLGIACATACRRIPGGLPVLLGGAAGDREADRTRASIRAKAAGAALGSGGRSKGQIQAGTRAEAGTARHSVISTSAMQPIWSAVRHAARQTSASPVSSTVRMNVSGRSPADGSVTRMPVADRSEMVHGMDLCSSAKIMPSMLRTARISARRSIIVWARRSIVQTYVIRVQDKFRKLFKSYRSVLGASRQATARAVDSMSFRSGPDQPGYPPIQTIEAAKARAIYRLNASKAALLRDAPTTRDAWPNADGVSRRLLNDAVADPGLATSLRCGAPRWRGRPRSAIGRRVQAQRVVSCDGRADRRSGPDCPGAGIRSQGSTRRSGTGGLVRLMLADRTAVGVSLMEPYSMQFGVDLIRQPGDTG